MKKVYLIQHCQSEHHVNELTGGWTDTPLTDLGKWQAEQVAKELRQLGLNEPFRLISSDLLRASMTAEYISKEFNVELETTKDIREINNGVAAGKTQEWANEHKLCHSNALEIDRLTWENGETPRDLYNRMKRFMEDVILPSNEVLVVVAHGVANGSLCAAWMGLEVEKTTQAIFRGNAGGITVFDQSPFGQRTITLFNSMTHLRK